MKSFAFFLAALMAIMSLATFGSATLVDRDSKEVARVFKEMEVRGVPEDLIDSVRNMIVRRQATSDPAIVTASCVSGPAPTPGTPGTSGVPGVPGVPGSSAPPTTAPPATTVATSDVVAPPPASTPVASTSVPATGPPVDTATVVVPSETAVTSSTIGVPPESTPTPNTSTIGIVPSDPATSLQTTTTGTATQTSTSGPESTAPPAETTPAAPNKAGTVKMNLCVLGVAALAALY